MAKKSGAKKVPATAAKEIGHARLELPAEDYERIKRIAKRDGLSATAYIRQAVLRQLRQDEKELQE